EAATQTKRRVLAAGDDPYATNIPPAYNPYGPNATVPDASEPLGVEPPPFPPYDEDAADAANPVQAIPQSAPSGEDADGAPESP
ncbi:hypothetical protein H632_c4961p0, partial [Helicosporidium sp. ATCC 50920]